jgi:hypothetical protein
MGQEAVASVGHRSVLVHRVYSTFGRVLPQVVAEFLHGSDGLGVTNP